MLEQVRAAQAQELAQAHRATVDQHQLAQLQRERDEADEARRRAERVSQQARREATGSTAEARRLQDVLRAHEAEMAAASERSMRLDALTDRCNEQQRQLEVARAQAARLATMLDDRDREILALQVEARNSRVTWQAEEATNRGEWEEERLVQLRKIVAGEHRDEARRSQEALERLQRALEMMRREHEGLIDTHRDCADVIAEEQRRARLAERNVEDLEARNATWRAEMEESLRQPAELALRTAREEADTLTARARSEAAHLAAEVDELRGAHQTLSRDVRQLEGRVGVLTAEAERLEKRIEDARPRAVEDDERLASLCTPACPHPAPVAPFVTEDVWLDQLAKGVHEAGFDFHARLLRAFHTSLKVADFAPLTVLAGISGTGKSELPRLYADLAGIPFLEIAVQPGWDSPQDLFGFFNYTDGRVKAEPLARLLQQLQTDGEGLGQGPVLVLLDEMNLARVEYYFADLLSKLEARRRASDEGRDRASVQLDVGPGRPAHGLFVDPKVLFVGTMNEDESTLALSDKVIDRASMLTFPAPRSMTLMKQSRSNPAEQRLAWTTWRGWQQKLEMDADHEWLNGINHHMQAVGRPFGHRVFRAIHAYLANYPRHGGGSVEQAREDQWTMKILPRLRGLECDERAVRDGLDALQSQLPEGLAQPFAHARSREFFRWEGAPDLYGRS
ncbi:MAG: AAA family ATPase [Alphaproteobacteria bacterium]|nr:AAA family ATPase [Alphaproteobacteria bacterium]